MLLNKILIKLLHIKYERIVNTKCRECSSDFDCRYCPTLSFTDSIVILIHNLRK